MDFSNFQIAELPKPKTEKKQKRFLIEVTPDDRGAIITVFDNDNNCRCFDIQLTRFSRLSDWLSKLDSEYKPNMIKRNDLPE